MKRSEMIKKLANIIYDAQGQFGEPDESVANEVLNELEKLGMQPPGYMKPIPFEQDGKQYPLVPGDFPDDKGVWCTPGVNEWEPEDGQI